MWPPSPVPAILSQSLCLEKILYKNVLYLICGRHLPCLPYCLNCCVLKNSVQECSLSYIWPPSCVPAIESQLLCLEKFCTRMFFIFMWPPSQVPAIESQLLCFEKFCTRMFFILYLATILRACHRVSIIRFGTNLYKKFLYLICGRHRPCLP